MALTAAPIGPQCYREKYPAKKASAGKSREDVRLTLDTWGLNNLALLAEAVISELVTNVLRHCQSCTDTIKVEVVRDSPTGIRISVFDRCPEIPRMRCADLTEEGGRGLLLVDDASSKWGVKELPHGKEVWAEIREQPSLIPL